MVKTVIIIVQILVIVIIIRNKYNLRNIMESMNIYRI